MLKEILVIDDLSTGKSDNLTKFKDSKKVKFINKKVEDIQKRLMSNPESLSQTTTKLLGQKTMNFIFSSCEFEYYKDEPVKE